VEGSGVGFGQIERGWVWGNWFTINHFPKINKGILVKGKIF
jgi:hypothetical protein